MRKDPKKEKLAALKALRNEPHDQTMRCSGISILYGPSDGAMTETRRFLEAEIRRLEDAIHMDEMEAFTSD